MTLKEFFFKRTPVWVVCIGAVLSIVLGYYIAAAASPGGNVFTWYQSITMICSDTRSMFGKIYWNKYSLPTMIFTLFAYILIWMIYVLSQKDYMHGKEYGSSKVADPVAISKVLADRSKNIYDPYNIVLLIPKKKRKKK